MEVATAPEVDLDKATRPQAVVEAAIRLRLLQHPRLDNEAGASVCVAGHDTDGDKITYGK